MQLRIFELDFVREGLNEGFKFHNFALRRTAAASGESFRVCITARAAATLVVDAMKLDDDDFTLFDLPRRHELDRTELDKLAGARCSPRSAPGPFCRPG